MHIGRSLGYPQSRGLRWQDKNGEVTRLSIQSLILIWSHLHDRWGDRMRDYMDRRVTTPTWGSPSSCKQAPRAFLQIHVFIRGS